MTSRFPQSYNDNDDETKTSEEQKHEKKSSVSGNASQRHPSEAAKVDPSKISEMGKKARERFAEERKKRKTIKVLSDKNGQGMPPYPLQLDPRRDNSTPPKKRQVKRSIQDIKTHETLADTHETIPELTQCVPMHQRSDVVRIHGAPANVVTPEMIRKFFVGLDEEIDRIFSLPYHPFRIEHFDDVPSLESPSKQRICATERELYTFRLFVKFNSKTAAALAVERSGEVLKLSSKSSAIRENLGNVGGVVLLVSPVSKAVVQCLLPKMVCFVLHS